uniref:CDK5RAP1-like protein n=1 Tax=Steinernema glaseri TaxID=37863 RepID=A0A1I7Y1L5_9BILA
MKALLEALPRRLCALQRRCSSAKAAATTSRIPNDGLGLDHFIAKSQAEQRHTRQAKIIPSLADSETYLSPEDYHGRGRKVKFMTYGCQMNVSDMEIVRSMLFANGYAETESKAQADVILLMTCSIREGAEEKIWKELKKIRSASKRQVVGVLGCMAERVRHTILEKAKKVDVVAGPDAYRDLPRLLAVAGTGRNAINVQLSLEETYANVNPVRTDPESKSAFVSIMRGCDNMCTYCVVPYTRGRERSRPISWILDEVRRLSDEGVKQVTLLGQNVNSYRDQSETSFHLATSSTSTVPGFRTVYKPKTGGLTFLTLLDKVSSIDPEMRIRFTSPHPKDFPLEVIHLIRERANICNQLHIPAQSGNDAVLEAMGRGYSRELYLNLIRDVRSVLPDVALTSDFIAGFCGETEEAHQDTLSLMREVQYSFCYVFPYSMRGKTRASRRLVDDVPEEVKQQRHEELATVFREGALAFNQKEINRERLVLIEEMGTKRSASAVSGRTDGGVKVIFENEPLPSEVDGSERALLPGDYVRVKVTGATSQTLSALPISRTTLGKYRSQKL